MATKLKFVIGRDGKVTIEGDGCSGPKCVTMSRPFEDALGIVENRDLKPEYEEVVDPLKNELFAIN